VVSADAVCEGLEEAGHHPVRIEVDPHGVWRRDGIGMAIEPGRGLREADVVFSTLQGPFGEDGAVQGLMECLDIPYVGAGVLTSAICQDKVRFKEVVSRAGIPQAAYRVVHRAEFQLSPETVTSGLAELGPILFVKPASQGSSVGISRAVSPSSLLAALESAFQYGPVVVVEEEVTGAEIECAVVGNDEPTVSQPGEVVLVAGGPGWFDYRTKYTPGSIQVIIPARVPRPVRARVRDLARETFLDVGCHGLARVDFFVDGERIVLNEINTMPVLKKTSTFPLLFQSNGISYPELIHQLLLLALERHARRWRYRT
jgi:D-alanine-D-alanine ligase